MKRFAAVLASVALLFAADLVEGCGRSSLGELSGVEPGDASSEGGFDGEPPDGFADGPFGEGGREGGRDGGPDGGNHGCKSNKDCASTPSTPYCEIPPGKCVACETSAQCPPGDACHDHECVPVCGSGGACSGGLSCCDSFCVNEKTDPEDCGGCGKACPPGEACVGSVCQVPTTCNGGPPCSPEDQCCSSGCSDTNSDPDNCGSCGKVCATDQTCAGGTCHSPVGCNGGPACPPVDLCCATGCEDTSSDPNNCGGCGHVCAPGQSCVESVCQMGPNCHGEPACTGAQSCCASGCTNTKTDPENCGGCGLPCAPGDTCAGGMCQTMIACGDGGVCTGTQTCCPSGCTDTTGDPLNCGGCDMPCPPDDTCVSSTCVAPLTCNGGPACTAPDQCCSSGCVDTTGDPNNCGHCGTTCPLGDTCVSSVCTAVTFCGVSPACAPGLTCCPEPTGCTDTNTDPDNCGGCGMPCLAPGVCAGGTCSTSEGSLSPFVNPTYLTPGVHTYTTIDIPYGVTVYVAGGGVGSGTLQLNATGAITVDGVIDLTGGPGTQNTITSMSTESGSAGSGGYTGEPYQSASPSMPCGYVSGNPGLLGFAAEGTPGGCTIFTGCAFMYAGPLVFTAILADYGGGAGIFSGYRAYGSGGGGPAGGAPGALGAAYPGEEDCAGVAGSGGATEGLGGVGGGAPYDGAAGISGQTQCPGVMPSVPPAYVGGGGGGSIGPFASADLAVTTTFQPGSGGGGGSSDYLNRPFFGGTSGGGGGGGALMLSTPATISISGQVLANGGVGGDAFIGTGSATMCNPQPGAGGGGGSGGIIYMTAPSITVSSGAVISAVGGTGGAQSEFATGGGGGAGGIGRIRLSVTPSTCTLSGTFSPPLASGCSAASASGSTYIGVYPD